MDKIHAALKLHKKALSIREIIKRLFKVKRITAIQKTKKAKGFSQMDKMHFIIDLVKVINSSWRSKNSKNRRSNKINLKV